MLFVVLTCVIALTVVLMAGGIITWKKKKHKTIDEEIKQWTFLCLDR